MSSIDNGGSERSVRPVVGQEESPCNAFFLDRHDAGQLAYRLSRGIGADRLPRQDVRDLLAWAESTRRDQRMLDKLIDEQVFVAAVRDGRPVWGAEAPAPDSANGVSTVAALAGNGAVPVAPPPDEAGGPGEIKPEIAAEYRPHWWDAEDPEDLPLAPPEAGFLNAMPDGEMLTVREADGSLEEVEIRATVAEFFNLDTANSDQSWVGQTADGRWFYGEDHRGHTVCCRVYPTLAAVARSLWAQRKEETTVLAVLDELGFLRFELRE